MYRITLVLFLIFFLDSNMVLSQKEDFVGDFYPLEKENNEFFLSENCWSMQLDILSIAQLLDEDQYKYLMVFNSFHVETYYVFNVRYEHSFTFLEAHLEDESDEVHIFKIRYFDDKVAIEHVNFNSETVYISKTDNSNYQYVPCEDDFEIEDDSNLDLQAALLNFLDPLFTGDKVEFGPFIGIEGFEFTYPDSNGSPIQTQLYNSSKLYTNNFYKHLVNSVPDGTLAQLPFFFYNELPVFCAEKELNKGIYVSTDDSIDQQTITIIIFLKDGAGDSNGMKFELVMDKEGKLMVRSVLLNECKA